jgi:hypothetical protein
MQQYPFTSKPFFCESMTFRLRDARMYSHPPPGIRGTALRFAFLWLSWLFLFRRTHDLT